MSFFINLLDKNPNILTGRVFKNKDKDMFVFAASNYEIYDNRIISKIIIDCDIFICS